ncbi:hypothetical protein DFA_11670 [Cavenderia fasciculata]|uniref:Methyltransferase type 11 domain-containing protein n=1 Tax=Cavenderia fasciculata TaxID=261658 RepID=F4QDW2_CACFS|nr:uncharacterized protein DFA_11670 [Cavenderia fasciculata]EGG13909.1 hypothetical protein DFA_11670 [Cavenderia fasciculata]|eukprot:XP_004350617.1 hypothetical protein DFA_11670 [Cavenderia fasciculata]
MSKQQQKQQKPPVEQHQHKRKKPVVEEEEISEEEEIIDEEELSLDDLKEQFKMMVSMIKENERDMIEFTSYVCNQLNVKIDEHKNPAEDESMQDNILATIIQDLKEELPSLDTKAPNENIIIPKNENFKDYTKENTVSVDGFLYSESDVDELIERGKLANNYCLDCNSHNTSPLNFISHSTSPIQLKYIFGKQVLGNLKNKTVLDIGSRLGAVLYSGYLFSDAKQLIGLEIDPFFCKLQEKMVAKYQMEDRVTLVQGDVFKVGDKHIEAANVIFMNNVLEFFEADRAKHIAFWNNLKKLTAAKKGMQIVTIPAIEDTFKSNKLGLSIKGWLKREQIVPPDHIHPDDQEFDDYKEICLYRVI